MRPVPERHGETVIPALALIALALFGYLLYSLLRPEDF
ncbi:MULTISPECIES: K(+)-transporting ATPase subunit F [Deinococcus]|nr:K(+)-transporting ATPase subunit F [Deinococcus phoenicis]